MGAIENYIFYGYDVEELKKIESLYKPKNVKFENLNYNQDIEKTSDNLIEKYIEDKIEKSVLIIDLDKFKNIEIKKTIEFFKFLNEGLGLKSVFVTNNQSLLKKSFIKGIPNILKKNYKQLFETLKKVSVKNFKFEFSEKKFFTSLILNSKEHNQLNTELVNYIENVWHNMSPKDKLLLENQLKLNLKKLNFEQKLEIQISLKISKLEKLIKIKNAFPKKQLNEMIKQYITLNKQQEILKNNPNSTKAKEIIKRYKTKSNLIKKKTSEIKSKKLFISRKKRR